MKEYGKVTTTNVIILATVTIVFIGAFICAFPILQQKTNAQYEPNPPYSGGGEVPVKPFHPPNSGGEGPPPPFHPSSDAAQSKQQGEFNTSGPHENSTRLK